MPESLEIQHIRYVF